MRGLRREARRRLTIVLSLAGIVTVASGHIGSPDTIFEGMAGHYPVRVIISAPKVIPAKVDVFVRVSGAHRVRAGMRYWNTHASDAPAPDLLSRIPGDSTLWTTSLWVMLQGSFALQVSVEGDSGSGSVIVPVSAVAQRIAPFDAKTGVPLAILFTALAAGLITIAGAATSEAILDPGMQPSAADRRASVRARLLAGTLLVILLGAFGTWWRRVDREHRNEVFVPTRLALSQHDDGSRQTLRLSFHSVEPLAPGAKHPTPLIPDHGKMMHLFLVSRDMGAMAHLHPVAIDPTTFETDLPPLPAARYYVFGDVVHESGFAETLLGADTISSPPVRWDRTDADDAMYAETDSSSNTLPNNARLVWDDPGSIRRVGADARLSFTLRDSAGRMMDVNPYLGMVGHAVVVRADGAVYTHLHPAGTASLGAQLALSTGPFGDGQHADGPAAPSVHTAMSVTSNSALASEPTMRGQLAFPYVFPQPGSYTIWVQFRVRGSVRTAVFHARVESR